MTQEEKDLLLKDLCARLPYGVKVEYLYWDEGKCEEYPVPMAVYSVNADGYMELIGDVDEGGGHIEIDKYLPYLRPMSSMTEEEKAQMAHDCYVISLDFENRTTDMVALWNTPRVINWLLKHHFDFMGLIERGLAIAITKENNPYEA